jgi:hypothetical protein
MNSRYEGDIMASTGNSPVPAPVPNFGRRIKWLGVFALALAVAWTAAWFWLAGLGETKVDAALAKVNAQGRPVACDNRSIKGYPFRFGLFCDSVRVEDPTRGIRISASALRTAAQVYNPWHLIAELDGPALIDAPGLQPLEIHWSLLHASVRANKPLPDRMSLESKGLDVSIRIEAGAVARAIAADYAAGHMRREDKDVAIAGEAGGLAIDPAITPGRTIPLLSASYDIVLKDGVRIIAARPKDIRAALRGASGEIRNAVIIFADGGEARVKGPVSADAAGLIDGDITVTFKDGDKLGLALAKALPEAASVIQPALSAAAMAAGKDREANLTLTIRKGKVSAGFFPIGKIPPI